MAGSSEPGQAASRATPPVGLAVVSAVAVICVLAAAFGGGWQLTPRFGIWDSEGFLPPPPPPMPPEGVVPPPPPAYLGVWVTVLFTAMAALFIGAVIWMLLGLRHRRRRRRLVETAAEAPAGVIGHPDMPTLLRGAEAAVDLLAQPGEPKDAIVRSWLAMEEAAAQSGAARSPAASPTEFTATVLTTTEADPEAVEGLLRLYHLARFSRHEIGLEQVTQARACVRRIATSWRRFDGALRATVPGP